MSNPKAFKDWFNQIDQSESEEIDHLIERKVKTLRRNKHLRWVMVPLSSLLSLVIAFALLVNLNNAFYVYALTNPVLGPLTKLVNGRQDILSAFDSGYVQLIDQKITVGDYVLEVDSIISDTRSINIFYKVRFQGELISEYDPSHSQNIEFISLSGEPINFGISYKHFESYWWGEISLLKINDYKPFIIKFTPRAEFTDQFGELQINIDQTKVIQPETVQINKTIEVAGQKIFVKSLEMGAFSSQLTYYLDPENDKLLVLFNFKDFTSGNSFDDESAVNDYLYENFAFGQMNHEKTFSLQLKNASILDRTFETVRFDPKTSSFIALPEHLTLKDVIVDGNTYEIILEENQSVGNQGLMPILDYDISDISWFSEGSATSNLQTLHIRFNLVDDQMVTFRVLGGTQITDLPESIIIKLP